MLAVVILAQLRMWEGVAELEGLRVFAGSGREPCPGGVAGGRYGMPDTGLT